MDHVAFRGWRRCCVKGRSETRGRTWKKECQREAPAIGVDYTHMLSEREKEEEKGMPTLALKGSRTRMIKSKTLQNKGVTDYATTQWDR